LLDIAQLEARKQLIWFSDDRPGGHSGVQRRSARRMPFAALLQQQQQQ
jgi:hypothetical protein